MWDTPGGVVGDLVSLGLGVAVGAAQYLSCGESAGPQEKGLWGEPGSSSYCQPPSWVIPRVVGLGLINGLSVLGCRGADNSLPLVPAASPPQ